MRILYLCGREPEYIRNLMLRRTLRRALGYDVVELTSSSRNFLARYASVAVRYLLSGRRPFDLIMLGFYGQPLMPWVRLWARAPILFDPYVSTYDTLCFDRRWFQPRSIGGRLAYALDLWTCRWADRLLLDTQTHRDYFARTFGLPPGKIHVLYVGCDETQFAPQPRPQSGPAERFEVFTYASFLRLHGVEQILYAARHLAGQRGLIFTIAGTGPRLAQMQCLARDLGLENVRFPGWLPFDSIPACIAQADLCLGGHFGDVAKARRVIATKTFQFLAMAKPTIVGDNPANREVMAHEVNAYLCPMADASALAEAIYQVYRDADLREGIARNGRRLFEERFSLEAQAGHLQEIVEGMFA
jgi:glycosyltransferase involved in cell wall biosynthesis